MARPKSGNDGPTRDGGGGGGEGDHPGAYVQVVGAPRRRKSSGKLPVQSGERATDGSSSTYSQGQKIEERVPVAGRHARSPGRGRAHGPLGVEAPANRTQAAAHTHDSAPRYHDHTGRFRAPVVAKAIVEVDGRREMPSPVSDDEPGVELPSGGALLDAPPDMGEPSFASGPAYDDEDLGPFDGSANTNQQAALVRASVRPTPSSPPRPSLRPSVPSVLDARPDLRSEPPAPKGTPWGLILSVAALSSIIAAAGVVALQEWLRTQDAPAAAMVAPVSAPTQPSAKAADEARENLPAPPVPAATTPAPDEHTQQVPSAAPSAPEESAPEAAPPATESPVARESARTKRRAARRGEASTTSAEAQRGGDQDKAAPSREPLAADDAKQAPADPATSGQTPSAPTMGLPNNPYAD
jgi:hypothetical protein